MQPPILPPNEDSRLLALTQAELLDTAEELRFDRLTQLTQQIFKTSIVLISLVDAQRQWFKSRQGLDACETGRDISFCGHAILKDEIFNISDASKDPRFADNPLVTGAPNIRFYAGAPLHIGKDHRIGTLCIIDEKPRTLSENELAILRNLADCVEREINQVELKQASDTLSLTERMGTVIAKAQSEFIVQNSRETAFNSLLEDVLALTNSEYGFIGEILYNEEEEPYLKTFAISNIAWNEESRLFYQQNVPTGLEFRNLKSLFGEAMLTGEAVIANSPATDPRRGGLPVGHPSLDAFLGLPIYRGGDMIAMLGIANRPNGYDQKLVDFLHPLLASIGQLVAAARIQKKHQESERRLRAIIEATNVGTWQWDIQSGEALVNERWAEIVGYSLSEFPNFSVNSWVSLVHPADLIANKALLKRHFKREVEYCDLKYRMKHKAGHWVWVQDRGRVYHWSENGQALLMYGTHTDISEQKQAEFEREKVNNLLTNVMQSAASFSIIATDPEGTIIAFNRGAENLLGYTAEEMVGQHSLAITHLPAEVQARSKELSVEFGYPIEGFKVFVIQAEREGSESREWTYVTKNGKYLPVILVVTTMRDNAGCITGYLGIAQDITQQKAALKSIKNSQQKLQTFFDLSLNFLAIANVDGYFEKISNAFNAKLGYNETELMRQPFLSFIHPDDIEKTKNEIKKLSEGKLTISFVNRYRCKNGEYVSLIWSCAPDVNTGKLYATASDITQQINHEQFIRDQAQYTQAILDNMVDGIITTNYQGIVDAINPAALAIFGYTENEIIGKNLKYLMPSPHQENHDSYLVEYQQSKISKAIGHNREVEGKRKSGELFPLEIAVSEVTRQDQTMYVGLVRDISERKRMERMKSEFVSTVSHELRTPLTSISGALGLITGGAFGELPEQINKMLNIAEKNSQRLTYLINDLLDMEKLAAGKMLFEMDEQLFSPLIESSIEANRGYGAERKISISYNSGNIDASVNIDSHRLMQVMSNLLSNAIKYSPKGDTVTVTLSATESHVKVVVSDNGPGIDKAFHARIFQKFSQADSSDDRQKGGTGLGLAITKGLVERMGGTVGFTSVEGKGSDFYFEFPCKQKSISKTTAPLDRHLNKEPGPKVLVVENDHDVAQLIARLLTRSGYQVDIVNSGEEALLALKHKLYSAITVDLNLPGISGNELIQEIRNTPQTKHLPVLIISAEIEAGLLAIKNDSVGIEWISKPFEQNQLIDTINRLSQEEERKCSRVLHVEDDDDLHQVIKSMLGEQIEIINAATLKHARQLLTDKPFDLILLDIYLPDGKGWDLLPFIRKITPAPRVIVLSSNETTPDEASQVEKTLLKSQVTPKALLKALHLDTYFNNFLRK